MGDTVFGVKRCLGLNVSEAVREVTHLVMTDPGTKKMIIRAESHDKSFQGLYPEYIAGIILATVKKTAELYLGSKITSGCDQCSRCIWETAKTGNNRCIHHWRL